MDGEAAPERAAATPPEGRLAASPFRAFALAERETLPTFTLEYRRPPDRVAYIPTRLLSIDAARVCWLNEFAPKEPHRFDGAVVLDRGYHGVWFIANGASHDLGKVYTPDGRHTGYYVDILAPVRWQSASIATLSPLTDLFLDLWLTPDGRWRVLDEPEFRAAEARGWITPAQAVHARRTLAHLIELARAGALVTPEARAFALHR
jgi:predicted RNA-binding protein associated with RNAse of E/G family